MKTPKHVQASRLRATIRAAGQNLLVVVGKEYAQHFQAVPKDGNTYMVQDPVHPSIQHVTRSDGSYVRLDGKHATYRLRGAEMSSTVKVDVHIKGCTRNVAKKSHRLANQIGNGVAIRRQLETTPEICLIDIHRVMLISGFGRSFIHAHPTFPVPVRLGKSRRAASRWIESEVIRWANDLAAQRSTTRA